MCEMWIPNQQIVKRSRKKLRLPLNAKKKDSTNDSWLDEHVLEFSMWKSLCEDLSGSTQGRHSDEELRNRKEMHIRSQQLGARGISMDMKTSWAAQEYDSTFPNLKTMVQISKIHKFQ